MAFALRPGESVRPGLRRLVRKELRAAVDQLKHPRPSREDAIHEARRSVKKARAILTIFEEDDGSGLGKSRQRLQDVGRSLSQLRDADVRVETFGHLRRQAPRALPRRAFSLVRRQLVKERQKLARELDLEQTFEDAADELTAIRRRSAGWRSAHKQVKSVLAAVKAARRRGRLAMTRAQRGGRAVDFHEWRKTVKELMYELELIQACGTGVRAEIRRLNRIEEWLGEDHNVVVLCERLFKDEWIEHTCRRVDVFRKAVARYQRRLREKALRHGEYLYSHLSAKYIEQLRQCWNQVR